MNLTSLTNPALINLQTTFESRNAAIEALAEQLDQQGKLFDKTEYLQAVYAREEEGPTALGEGLAVPHGKTDAVKEAAFAVATLKQDLKWKGLDEDEDVNLIFLIAIPNAEAGSTHMQLLTELTSTLVDDDIREAVLKAQTVEQIMALLGEDEPETKEPEVIAPEPVVERKSEAESGFLGAIGASVSKLFGR
ncbi:PTS sugar transporter subunit IIA [Vibrio sp. SCSIO 43136]|nr:PTS sugar transporter subunit IIA [Vibrio sp. SCSIO 43136]